ncbi:MAG: 2-phosphosulfolactate phosphatase [candidate division Zixibacteria bacterium]|nr:2-phosphosulfolactate phosphatase [candidate division Zixibacteria bacterium]
MMRIDVSFTPQSLTQKKVDGRQIVAIDVLRASSTMVTALANGARGIVPVAEPSQAVEVRTKLGAEHVLLGGERGGIKIENFDLGNSPLEYTRDIVGGKVIAMCSTNGTALFTLFRYSGPVLVVCFLNLSAVCREIVEEKSDLALLCAGDEGDYSSEDALCAGALIDKLADTPLDEISMNDSAKLALLHYNASRERLADSLRESAHGRELAALGFGEDITFVSEIDRYNIAPCFESGQIVLKETVSESGPKL